MSRFFLIVSLCLSSMSLHAAGSLSIDELKQSFAKFRQIDDVVLESSAMAFYCAGQLKGKAIKNYLAIIDYTKPSTEKRLWVVDVKNGQLISEQLVAHGQGSGGKMAQSFSNKNGSHQSSLGVFLTAEAYQGKHGRSLRLLGLEPGFNDKARQRAIVMHAAEYVNRNFIEKNGTLGRSWGCPALDPEYADQTIDIIKEGSVVVAYYDNKKWLQQSIYLHC